MQKEILLTTSWPAKEMFVVAHKSLLIATFFSMTLKMIMFHTKVMANFMNKCLFIKQVGFPTKARGVFWVLW